MTKPTIRELLGWFTPEFLRHQEAQSVVEAGAQLVKRVEAVLRLHTKRGRFCRQCSQAYDEGGIGWPCPTIRALNGDFE